MSNRAQRRAMARSTQKRNDALLSGLTKQQAMARLLQNGITPEDCRQEYERGYQEGAAHSRENTMKCCYAAVILALREEFGFDDDQCFRAVGAVDHKIVWALDHKELIDRVLRETHLELELDEGIERVQKKG